jgi:FlaA1/EpsC-like NDP-sugar epimerase
MEANAEDAVTNNVLGTRNLLDAAVSADVAHLVMISTDKAVNPTSVMGATKRLAEMLLQEYARRHERHFVAVRFGNVLGSRGSVVPLFKEQIARGGPVTVTHPDICRYFMTIPEAVQLVLQAATMGVGGEIFVLDMGKPIRIADLARDMIELSGCEVGTDIAIEFTGLRPGEKLYEELALDAEQHVQSAHERIFSLRNGHQPDEEQIRAFHRGLDGLLTAARNGNAAAVRSALQALVPEYGAMAEIGPPSISHTGRAVESVPERTFRGEAGIGRPPGNTQWAPRRAS